jgi:ABC-type polysaccharide transport system permease subunit
MTVPPAQRNRRERMRRSCPGPAPPDRPRFLSGSKERSALTADAAWKRNRIVKNLIRNRWIYLMILPGLLYILIYKYIPMYGLIISFQDYKPYKGILGSEWVGFKHFERLFLSPDFWMILRNTLMLFALQLFIYFPIPILLALMLNEVRSVLFKRTVRHSSICRILCPGWSSYPSAT